MGVCSSDQSTGEAQPGKESKQLDDKLHQIQVEESSIHKLLLLGPGDSGKSTLFKQLMTLYGTRFSEQDKKLYLVTIYRNLVSWIEELAKQSVELPKKDQAYSNCAVVDPTAKQSVKYMLEMKHEDGKVWASEVVGHLKILWADPGIQNTYNNRAKFHINDSADFFLNKIDELAKPNFLTSDQDVVRCRARTTGIVENEFVIDKNRFKLVDVGGQRNERKKWIHCFENVTCVLYVVDISGYDGMLFEDETVNRVEESLNLFENLCNSKWFRDTSFILFLNKSDLFQEKVKKVPLTVCFPDYTGGNSYEAGISFFEQEFLKRNHYKKPIYSHVTCATDSRIVGVIFNGVKDIVVREALVKAGLT